MALGAMWGVQARFLAHDLSSLRKLMAGFFLGQILRCHCTVLRTRFERPRWDRSAEDRPEAERDVLIPVAG
jgi:hypothetical protein